MLSGILIFTFPPLFSFTVPTEPPTNFSILAVSHVELALSWKDIPVLSTHGIMRNFTISCNGTLANQSLHRRDKVIVYPVAAGITQHSYNMTDLYPYTVYNCTVQGCTTPGCGPTVEKSQQTLEYCTFLHQLFKCIIRLSAMSRSHKNTQKQVSLPA